MIHQFKFNAKLYLGRLLADLFVAGLPTQAQAAECIIPVPLHQRRFRQRGFNQSMELARHIGKALSIPVDHRSCRKILYTEAQTGKNARQRRHNVKDAFHFENTAEYGHVIVLDDVVTTGSTVSEITRVMKRQGVRRVDVWSVARAPLKV
jgi:ComF family protein